MEDVELKKQFWNGRRVLVTGHTGFKGGWLSLWLSSLGAKVFGYSLAPKDDQGIFIAARVKTSLVGETIADICDFDSLSRVICEFKPEIIFHLAAQAIVRTSFEDPRETFQTNVFGLINLFEAVRESSASVQAMVNVTSDKCYHNEEWVWTYRENDPLGGNDPYSASKGCAEIVSRSYQSSFFSKRGIALSTARAGNVFGGGDCSKDRLIPDFLSSLRDGRPLIVRNRMATRPWQHVLEPLNGYILLAQGLCENKKKYVGAWNFGPDLSDNLSVEKVVEILGQLSGISLWKEDPTDQPYESQLLALDSSKARHLLSWKPKWSIEIALRHTLDWENAKQEGLNMKDFSLSQIKSYEQSW